MSKLIYVQKWINQITIMQYFLIYFTPTFVGVKRPTGRMQAGSTHYYFRKWIKKSNYFNAPAVLTLVKMPTVLVDQKDAWPQQGYTCFKKNLQVLFQAPELWCEAINRLRTHKYLAPRYKVFGRPDAQNFCTPAPQNNRDCKELTDPISGRVTKRPIWQFKRVSCVNDQRVAQFLESIFIPQFFVCCTRYERIQSFIIRSTA